MGLMNRFIILGAAALLIGSITSVFAITDEEREILSNISTKTTQEIEEMIFLAGNKINESEWVDSNYNMRLVLVVYSVAMNSKSLILS